MSRIDRRSFLLLGLLPLAGCGYRPLYGTANDSRGVVASMAAVSIPEAEDRLTQIIRNDLLSTMRPAGTAAEDRYTLLLKTQFTKTDVIDKPLRPPLPVTTRQSARVTVTYELTGQGSDGPLTSGRTFSYVSFDVVRQPFADMQAETNAIERAAHEVSQDIRTRLAAYFASQEG